MHVENNTYEVRLKDPKLRPYPVTIQAPNRAAAIALAESTYGKNNILSVSVGYKEREDDSDYEFTAPSSSYAGFESLAPVLGLIVFFVVGYVYITVRDFLN